MCSHKANTNIDVITFSLIQLLKSIKTNLKSLIYEKELYFMYINPAPCIVNWGGHNGKG